MAKLRIIQATNRTTDQILGWWIGACRTHRSGVG
jgi:hypothetical protein